MSTTTAARKRATEKAHHVAELRRRYPWAKPDDGKLSTWARAAANIRQELRRAFPGVKFTVRSDSFSMGNSVNVGWDLGPTTREVDALLGKYQYGHFDGMEDIYRHDQSDFGDAVDIVLGRSKFVFGQRDIPPAARQVIAESLCRLQKIDYQGDATRHVFGPYDDESLSDHVYRLVTDQSFPAGAVVTGVEDCDERQGEHGRYDCRVTYDAPAQPEPGNGHLAAYVEKHYHTKRECDFWLVVLADRVDRNEFDRIRSACKAAGGWYSRKWGKCPGGFAFDDEHQATAFADSL